MAWQIEDAAAPMPVRKVKPAWLIEDAPDPTGSTAENLAAGAGKAIVDAWRGVKQMGAQAADFVAPRQTGSSRAAEVQAEIDEARRLDAPLMDTTAGKVGNVAGSVAMAAPTLAVPGLNTYTGATGIGALMGMVQPTSGDESRLMNTGTGVAFGAGGKMVGDAAASGIGRIMNWMRSSGASQQAANAGRDAASSAARAEGYVIPPSQANPSAWNRLLESISGKVQTAQHASARNQEVTNRLAKQALGLPQDQPITPHALKAVRDQAGQAYDALSTGQFVTDATFKGQIRALSDGQRLLAQQFPEIADDAVLKMAANLDNVTQVDGRTLIELSKALREKAAQAFKNSATDAGRFYKGAAMELEDLIERNLLYTGSGGQNALRAFQQARETIAKSYTVEGALNGATGTVNAQQLAAQLSRGKPLTGDLRTAAEFGQAFPKAAAPVERQGSVLPGSPLDWIAAGGLSAATGDPTMMAAVAARPLARSVLLSAPYQRLATTPAYGPGAGMRALEGFITSPTVRRLTPAAAASGAFVE